MSRYNIFQALLFLTILPHCLFAQDLRWQKQTADVQAGLRGLHVVNDSVVWVSGASGTLLLTSNGGKNWQHLTPPDSLDFRSLWAFNEKEAIIASAGQPARVYRTFDGGQQWQLIFEDASGRAFFDAIMFRNQTDGMLLSDPVDGKILLFKTLDGGTSWQLLELPAPFKGEAFFAASNSSIAMAGEKKAWIGTGGGAIRVLMTPDNGISWQVQEVPMPQYSKAAGIYALHFANEQQGVAVGGAYDKPEAANYTAMYTTDGGKNWQVSAQPPKGYRSGLDRLPGKQTYVAVGTNGSDISTNGGKSWRLLNKENLNSIRFSPSGNKAWAIGPKGAIFMIDVKP